MYNKTVIFATVLIAIVLVAIADPCMASDPPAPPLAPSQSPVSGISFLIMGGVILGLLRFRFRNK